MLSHLALDVGEATPNCFASIGRAFTGPNDLKSHQHDILPPHASEIEFGDDFLVIHEPAREES